MSATLFSITKSGDTIRVISPYHPEFVRKAGKNLRGRWENGAWHFDALHAVAVRALIKEVYGFEEGCRLVPLRVNFRDDGIDGRRSYVCRAGRLVASVKGRDSGAQLGPGVVVEDGEFTSSGSRAHPTVYADPGTVVVIHGVPLALAEAYVDGTAGYNGETYEIVVDSATRSLESVTVSREALSEERTRLLARLTEIDGLLASTTLERHVSESK